MVVPLLHATLNIDHTRKRLVWVNFVGAVNCDKKAMCVCVFFSDLFFFLSGTTTTFHTGRWNHQVRWSTLSPEASAGSKPLTYEAMNLNDRSMHLNAIMLEMNFTTQWDLSGLKARTIFNALEQTQTTLNQQAPPGLKGFHVNWQGSDSGSKWMQMRTDEIMQTSAFYGCGISVLFALVVLAIATGYELCC